MAMANARCMCKTCKEEFIVRVERPSRRSADEFEEWAPTHSEINADAAEAAASLGLPALKGSRKQVAWAETLRMTRFKQWQARIERASTPERRERRCKVFDYIMSRAVRASEWIDERHGNGREMLKQYEAMMADDPAADEGIAEYSRRELDDSLPAEPPAPGENMWITRKEAIYYAKKYHMEFMRGGQFGVALRGVKRIPELDALAERTSAPHCQSPAYMLTTHDSDITSYELHVPPLWVTAYGWA